MPTQALYLTERGDSAAVSVSDIHQGQIGDCFLLSAIGEMVAADPAAIASMIHLNADGTETVDLWSQTQGHMPGNDTTSFKAAPQTVSNSFAANAANNGAGQDVVGTQKEIWVQVLEKAYAQANGGYARIQNGGGPGRALEQLTGQAAAWAQPANLTASVLLKDIAAKDLIVLDTSHATAQCHLFGDHAYMFEGLDATHSSVRLGNPWGFDQPTLVPISQLSRVFAEVYIGHLHSV